MPRVIVCDVNETLLHVAALEPHFKQTFGEGRVLIFRSVKPVRSFSVRRMRFASPSS